MEKASIIIPVANREAELRRAINSVLNQTYHEIEIIIVENNSLHPELVRDISKSFEDERISFYSLKECKNANVARNFGMKKATGEYICFLDSDDEYEPNHLESSIKFIKSNKLDFCFGSIRIYDGKNYRIEYSRKLLKDENGPMYKFNEERLSASTITFVLSRNATISVQWDEKLDRHQDWDFFFCLIDTYKGDAKIEPTVLVHRKKGRKVNIPTNSVIRFYNKWKDKMNCNAKRFFLKYTIKNSVKTLNLNLFLWAIFNLFLIGIKS